MKEGDYVICGNQIMAIKKRVVWNNACWFELIDNTKQYAFWVEREVDLRLATETEILAAKLEGVI